MGPVVVVTNEPIGRRMASAASRAAHVARVLSVRHDVELVSCQAKSVSPIDGRAVAGPDRLASLAAKASAIVVQRNVLATQPELASIEAPIVVDWFDAASPHVSSASLAADARRGDLFLAANEAQRLHWAGLLAGVRNLSSEDANRLIRVVPSGTAPEARSGRQPIRSTFGSIAPHDPIIVWAGGIHDWLDPTLVVDALPLVLERVADARLVFLSGPHPNTGIDTMGVRGEVITRAREVKLFGTHVLFVTSWVDHGERLDWIADARVAVVADHGRFESTLAERTRLLDHAEAGVPTIGTDRDPLSRGWAANGAGETVPVGDVSAMADAIVRLCNDDVHHGELVAGARRLSSNLRWEDVLEPLVQWLDRPPRRSPNEGGSAATPRRNRQRVPRVAVRVGRIRRRATDRLRGLRTRSRHE